MGWWHSVKKYFEPFPILAGVQADGFQYSLGRQTKRVDWREVTRIDVGRSPTIGVEIFYAVMHLDSGATITLDDRDEMFQEFSSAVCANWPEIDAAWIRVFTGSPDIAEHATLWTARKVY